MDDLLGICILKLQKRNKFQNEPFEKILTSNNKLFYEQTRVQRILNETKRQIALLQHEIKEVSVDSIGNLSLVVEKVKNKLVLIQNELREKHNTESYERKMRIDLSKKVRDQNKLIADQNEELKVAKSELALFHEKLLVQESELNAKRNDCETIKRELEKSRNLVNSAEAKVRTLEIENMSLVGRILEEKKKTADDLNEMNGLVDGMKGLLGGGTTPTKQAPPLPQVLLPKQADAIEPNSGGGHADGGTEDDEAFICIARSPLPRPEPAVVLQAHAAAVNDLTCCDHGRYLLTAGADASLKLFDVSRLTSGYTKAAAAVRVMPTGAPAICVNVSSEVAPISASSHDGVESADCRRLAISSTSDTACRVFDLSSGALLTTLSGHANKVYTAKFVGTARAVTGSADRSLGLWDLAAAARLASLRTASAACAVDVAACNSIIASGHHDGSVRLWDLSSLQQTHLYSQTHSSNITCCLFSPSQPFHLLTMARDNRLCITDSRQTKSALMTLRSPRLRVPCDWSRACFSPDGAHIAAGGYEGVVVWSVVAQEEVCCLRAEGQPLSGVVWSKSGIAVGDKHGRVFIWKEHV